MLDFRARGIHGSPGSRERKKKSKEVNAGALIKIREVKVEKREDCTNTIYQAHFFSIEQQANRFKI